MSEKTPVSFLDYIVAGGGNNLSFFFPRPYFFGLPFFFLLDKFLNLSNSPATSVSLLPTDKKPLIKFNALTVIWIAFFIFSISLAVLISLNPSMMLWVGIRLIPVGRPCL